MNIKVASASLIPKALSCPFMQFNRIFLPQGLTGELNQKFLLPVFFLFKVDLQRQRYPFTSRKFKFQFLYQLISSEIHLLKPPKEIPSKITGTFL